MNQDAEHLRLLSIFHYVVAGLAALFSLFPLLYTTIGAIFIFAARHGTPKPGEELPPEFLGCLYDYCAVARVSESVVCGSANVRLKIDALRTAHATALSAQHQRHCANLAVTQ